MPADQLRIGIRDIADRLAPELRHLASARTDLSLEALDALRESLNRRRRDAAHTVDSSGVDIRDEVIRGEGEQPIPVRIYRGGPSPAPAVVYCHGGAFMLGNLDIDHLQCVELARRGSCTIVSVDYRLAPEHPYPAALDDLTAVLEWVAASAAELDVDATRLAVAGSSAGGALAAGLAQRCADKSAPHIVFQLLHQPVLDDRPTPSKAEFAAAPGIDGPTTLLMWDTYLAGGEPDADSVPARRTELAGVAGALITCSELDPLRDEAVDYAGLLTSAGVATELHIYPATCHGFDSFLPEWDVSRQLFERQGHALRRAFGNS
ncbi:MAG: acetyl esterase [Mycobacterium sp.]|nr:acetyl esterase [Mycobacterium sp.]